MVEIALASINSFAPVAQQAKVSPEEPIFVLTSSQLEEIISKAVQEALESPKDLHQIVLDQAKEIEALNAKLEAIQKDMDSLATNDLNQLRLIVRLRNEIIHNEPSTTEMERAKKIEKLCIDSPNHTISLSELRGRLGIDKAVLSRLLKRIDHNKFHLRRSQTDKRIRYLCLR